MVHRRTLPMAAAVAVLMAATTASATIVKSLDLEEMAREADVIVHGTVERQSASWNEERTRIYTVTEVRVTEGLKGPHQAGDVIRIRQLGGTVDGITQMIPGNAKLVRGEEVVLFLDRDEKKDLHYVVGMAQGKFRVDRSGPRPVVDRQLEGLALARVEGGEVRQLHEPPPVAAPAPALEDLKARIRRALAPRP